MTTIFAGREFAKKKEELLKDKVVGLKKKGITPKLVSILVGDDPASALYVSLKKKAAERIGAKLEVRSWKSDVAERSLIEEIRRLNEGPKVHGIMVQLPLPKNLKPQTLNIVNSIVPEKDVDGLGKHSPFVPAAVKAILEILEHAIKIVRRPLKDQPCKAAVVGSEGMVGKPLVRELKLRKFDVVGVDLAISYKLQATKTADVLISATGMPGLIKKDMVKAGAIVIDVGSPRGDVHSSVLDKASFITPVPGGVGPVTIACLLENLIDAAAGRYTGSPS